MNTSLGFVRLYAPELSSGSGGYLHLGSWPPPYYQMEPKPEKKLKDTCDYCGVTVGVGKLGKCLCCSGPRGME